MEIKHKDTGEVLFASEKETLREVVEEANRAGKKLCSASLRGADLAGITIGELDLQAQYPSAHHATIRHGAVT